jgi:uncharacterized membrane protein
MKIIKVKKMKQLKKHQQGDAGTTLVIVMVVMMLGFFGYQGMWAGEGHHSRAADASQQEKTPLDLLDEMYVRGEISREEYFRKREDLLEH